MISDERAEKAMRYLAESDEPAAAAKADMERAEYRVKAMKSQVFLHSNGTVAERQATADTNETVIEAANAYFASIRAYSLLANKRETERIVMDTWRTVQANRRHG